MPERIVRLHLFGVVTELAHIPSGASVTLEESDPTDADQIEWVDIHVRSSVLPEFTEVKPVDEASDNTQLPVTTEREMVPREGSSAIVEADESTVDEPPHDPATEYDYPLNLQPGEHSVEELRDMLRDRDLPVSGTKADLIARLNGYHDMTVDALRDELRERDLSVSGTKAELIERLVEGDEGA